ncbi:MCM family protein [Halobacteriales archaeon QS_8_69_73]|nr:MAG: MCM family protein [Halobacteriales archaeon QS_8_69_73]
MARAEDTEVIDRFERFYRDYYRNEIGELAQKYPNEQRSLYVDWNDLYRFDPDLADDFLAQPDQMRDYAEEALRLYDLPVDVKLGQAHIRVRNLQETTDIRDIRARHRGQLIAVTGIVRKATDVRPKVTEAAFECQRCGTLTRIPQTSGEFYEPHECQGCERQGPFEINFDQSEFVDAQKLRVQESPEGLRGGETPQSIDVHIDDDITGQVTAGDHVRVTGILHLDQQGSDRDKSPVFDVYMDGITVDIEDEQFEDMDITDEDKKEIIELSNAGDIYEQMVGSMAPSIYGYEQEKLAIIMQLFSGVTKHLPDGSRIRGDLHMLLIGDPGTGKCIRGDNKLTLSDGSEERIKDLVERNLTDPVSVDDGVYQSVDIEVSTMCPDGTIERSRATRVWKREAPDRMYRIRTASGRTVEVTPSHPLFVQSGGCPEATRAEDLERGTFVRSRANNAVRLHLPDEWTPELARLVGFIIAEGHVELDEDNCGDIRITNEDEEILTDTARALESLNLEYTVDEPRADESASVVRCNSGEFASFLENLEPSILERSAQRRVPDTLLSATPRTKREFLRAYIDAEGHVSAKEREISVASMSRELLENVRSLLLAVGIGAQIQPHSNDSYCLRISGKEFKKYVDRIGFVTARKSSEADDHEAVTGNTNRDVVPNIGEDLRQVRETLELSQSECGLPRSTYQHYERGDRNPSRESLEQVASAFRERLGWLRETRDQLRSGEWRDVEAVRDELNVSQRELADEMGVEQTAVSYYERNDAVPDGGRTVAARNVLLERIKAALQAEQTVETLERLARSDIRWDRIKSIETVDPDYEWVYDLEVEGTHTYLSNNVISHNSQLLQYIRNLAPRSVYTSGKGSSSAGLCVTGDTMIHTDKGFRPIRKLAAGDIPAPVTTETAAESTVGVRTFDRDRGEMTDADASHVWRMPEKPCRRIETNYGKELEASVNTPVLVCGADGIEWRKISEIEPGDYVAAPRYDGIDRSAVPVREFLELSTEKVRLSDESVSLLRESLCEEFGTLRDAAAALDLSEDFIYLYLKNRHVPLEKLDRMLKAIGATRGDVQFDRLMVRHGDSITIPERFDRDLMYLLGLVFGDGDISLGRRDGNRGTVRISNGDETLLERAADIFETKFDKRPEIERQDDKVPCIRFSSVTVTRLLSNAGMETPKESLSLASRLTVGKHADAFLRGLMDADGSVSERESGGSSVLMSTISESLARQVQSMLETYGIRASVRERDRRGTTELEDGQTVETKHIQYFVEMYGADIDRYAERIGFGCSEKQQALERIVTEERRQQEKLPVGAALSTVETTAGQYYHNLNRGHNPGRARAQSMLEEIELGPVESDIREAVEADLRWDEVVAAVDTGEKEVFDLTVPETHNFIGNGVITHNTAAAVRDDFGDGQQWTLEAGALVLADQGIAAVDELDKMRPEDRSAMHEALEQQSYHPDTEVLLSDGRRVEIGEFVDGRMEASPEAVVDGVDCEILPVDDVGIHSVDFEDDETRKLPVDRVSRHEAPEEFVRVAFSNGREVTVTPEHPVFVDDEGEVGTVEARNIEEGAFVPAPRKLPNSSTAVELDGERQVGKEKDVDLPEALSGDLAEALGFLVAEGHSYAGSAHEIGFSNQDDRLLERMDRLMASVFGVESTDTTDGAGTVTKRWVSTKLYRWFERNFPEMMHTRRRSDGSSSARSPATAASRARRCPSRRPRRGCPAITPTRCRKSASRPVSTTTAPRTRGRCT